MVGMRVYLETMGCQMNRLDSELLMGLLTRAGHEMTDDRKRADAVLYNTCSVRRHAEDKVHSRIGADAQRKRNHRPRLVLGVLGCMAQRLGEGLRSKYPELDIVCGPSRLAELPELLADAAEGRGGVRVAPDRPECPERPAPEEIDALEAHRDLPAGQGGAQAFVRVMVGCDNFCTYCIVPYVRGPEVSRRPDRIVEEVRRLAEAGRSEITLLGQAVNRYEWRGGEASVRFSDLLERVSAVGGVRRLRFVTSHPKQFGDDVLAAMRDLPSVCPYMHCPAQSGSDAVLRRMNRGYTRAEYDDLVDRARATVPDLALAGDFIVGFPGETEADHEASTELIRRSGYKNSFVFKYSPRPGTTGARNLPDNVPDEIKRRRNHELLAVQAEVGRAHHEALIGRTMEVLVEGPSRRADRQPTPAGPGRTQLTGRTRGDHIVVFDGPESLAGRYVPARITGATSLTLFGALDGNPE